jgi:hypothetical protein
MKNFFSDREATLEGKSGGNDFAERLVSEILSRRTRVNLRKTGVIIESNEWPIAKKLINRGGDKLNVTKGEGSSNSNNRARASMKTPKKKRK